MRTTQHNGLPKPMLVLCCALLSTVLTTPALAQTTVFRCTAPDGSIEFREHPCQGGVQQRELEIRDNRTGWVPPEPAPREQPKTQRKPKQRSAKPETDKYADRCWQKRQQIERIDNELRAGYKPARGERLKDRRREYEAFLNRYCR
jgi:hypothetical protein